MPCTTDLTVPMSVVLTASTQPATALLDPVQKAVRRGFTETSVTTPVVVVRRDVNEKRGSVRGPVQSANSAHIVKKTAVRIVTRNVIKPPEYVSTVLTESLGSSVTRPVEQGVLVAVINTMETVRVNEDGLGICVQFMVDIFSCL